MASEDANVWGIGGRLRIQPVSAACRPGHRSSPDRSRARTDPSGWPAARGRVSMPKVGWSSKASIRAAEQGPRHGAESQERLPRNPTGARSASGRQDQVDRIGVSGGSAAISINPMAAGRKPSVGLDQLGSKRVVDWRFDCSPLWTAKISSTYVLLARIRSPFSTIQMPPCPRRCSVRPGFSIVGGSPTFPRLAAQVSGSGELEQPFELRPVAMAQDNDESKSSGPFLDTPTTNPFGRCV